MSLLSLLLFELREHNNKFIQKYLDIYIFKTLIRKLTIFPERGCVCEVRKYRNEEAEEICNSIIISLYIIPFLTIAEL